MKQLLTFILCFLALTGSAQYLEMLELEQYQIYDEQLAQNGTTGITHTIEFYKRGEIDASKNMRYEYKIDPKYGKVLEKISSTNTNRTKVVYHYDHFKCFYQSSEDYYELNGKTEHFLFRRYHTYNNNCTNVEYVDKDKDSVVLGSHKITHYPSFWPSNEYFYDANGKVIKHLKFTYSKDETDVTKSRLTKEYDANDRWVSAKRDYFLEGDFVYKTCQVDLYEREFRCFISRFEYDGNFTVRITQIEGKRDIHQKTFIRDQHNRVSKITIEKVNDYGVLEVVEIHQFSYNDKLGNN